MSTRFLTNAVVALLGGFVVVMSLALSSAVGVGWIAFGIAIGVLSIAALSQIDSRRGWFQQVLDLLLAADAGTLIAVSLVFGGTTVIWLAFALSLGFVGVAYTGLVVHEIATWRAAHDLNRLRGLEGDKDTVGARLTHQRAA